MVLSSNQIIWKEARRYLISKGLSEELIEKHLNLYKNAAPNSINDVYKRLISSLVNKQGFRHWIGNLSALEYFLKEYSVIDVLKVYSDWESFIDSLLTSDFQPPSAINKEDNRNSWVHFSKGVISGARYLDKFPNVSSFDNFIKEYTMRGNHIQLVNEISKEIHGYGFALTCDFLKELGYAEFVKPDTHIIDIFHGLGLSRSRKDVDVFHSVLKFAESVDEVPYRVDKMFWLIGSRRPYLISDKIRIPTNKFEFIEHVKTLLREEGYTVKDIIVKNTPEKIVIDNQEKTQFRELNIILSSLRNKQKISAKEYREYAMRWRNYPELRRNLIEELSEKNLR